MIEHYCRNCGRHDPRQNCEYDNIERIFAQDTMTSCPMWVPVIANSQFASEVVRKYKKHMEYLEVITA